MNQDIFKIFLNGIKDTNGLYHVIDQLNFISKSLYHNKTGTITEKIGDQILQSLAAIFHFLEKNNLEPTGDSAQKEFIEEIIKYLRSVSLVKVTLAFEPDANFVSKLNDQISSILNQKVILDILVDQKIIAGLTVEYQGKFKDYSLEPRVKDYLRNNLKKMMVFNKEDI